jgi:hypothetical protein
LAVSLKEESKLRVYGNKMLRKKGLKRVGICR